MIFLYDDYLSAPMSLPLEEMAALHREMAEEVGSDSDALELYENLTAAATKYMFFRSNWFLWDREQRADKDPDRTSCHDMVIVRLNQLARYLKTQGKAASWREVLGQEADNPYFRKRMGDFACYLALVNGLAAR